MSEITEIKTLNGYPLADTKARTDIATLSEEIEKLKYGGDEDTTVSDVTVSMYENDFLNFKYDTSVFSGWRTNWTFAREMYLNKLQFRIKARDVAVTQVRVRIAMDECNDVNVVFDTTLDVNIPSGEDREITCNVPDVHIAKGQVVWVAVDANQISTFYFSATEPEEGNWPEYGYAVDGKLTCAMSGFDKGGKYRLWLIGSGYAITVNKSAGVAKLETPESYALVSGDTFEMFYKGIVNAVNPDLYDVVINCAKGNAYGKRYVWTPTAGDVGTHTMTINLYDWERELLDTKEIQLIVTSKAQSPQNVANCLCVGDSLTQAGTWPAEVHRRLTATDGTPSGDGLSNIAFIGTKKVGNVGYEGYGGWTFDSYNNANASSNAKIITCSHDKVEAVDQHSVYQDANGVQWKIETVYTDKLHIIAVNGAGASFPASGTLTWVSGGENHSNIVYSTSENAAGNPFWDATSGAVDFAAYASRLGVSTIDYVYVLLGWNNAGTSEAAYKAKVKNFVDNVLAAFPVCKVVLLGLQLPARDGLGVNYGATGVYSRYYDLMQHVYNLNHWYADVAAEYPNNVTSVNITGQFDTEHNMPSLTRPVNVRSTTTESYQSNGVHPAASGYMQIADAVYRDLTHKLQS